MRNHASVDDAVVAAGERALRPRWPDVRLTDPTALDGSPRARVLRCRVTGGDVDTLVVKAHLAADDAPPTAREAAVREAAALSLLVDRPGFVQLLGVGDDPPVVVMTDVGAATDLAELLLGTDADAASAGVTAWATAIAQLHSTAVGPRLQPALAEHAARLGRGTPDAEATPRMLATGAQQLAEQTPRVGVHITDTAFQELCDLEGLLGGGTGARALTPSDACPDNNAMGSGAAVLLDFEGAQVRHIAWDVAYLTVPWPSCWCSWRLPDEVAGRALGAYRENVDIPYARTPDFDDDLRAVTAGWAMVSTGWFLEQALVDDHTHTTHDAVMPRRRAVILHRLAKVQEPRLPAMTSLARELVAVLRARWGDLPLELAPAFRGDSVRP